MDLLKIKQFKIIKTAHKDVTDRLAQINPALASQARIVLDVNKSERHIRGGMATKEKYFIWENKKQWDGSLFGKENFILCRFRANLGIKCIFMYNEGIHFLYLYAQPAGVLPEKVLRTYDLTACQEGAAGRGVLKPGRAVWMRVIRWNGRV